MTAAEEGEGDVEQSLFTQILQQVVQSVGCCCIYKTSPPNYRVKLNDKKLHVIRIYSIVERGRSYSV